MSKQTNNTNKISVSPCEVAFETNATNTYASEQKQTLKEAVCSIIQILEQMKKILADDRKDSLVMEIDSLSSGRIGLSVYSGKVEDCWAASYKSFEDFKVLEFSEGRILDFLKSRFKNLEQKLQGEIKEVKADIGKKESDISEPKGKLAKLSQKMKYKKNKKKGGREI